MSQPEYIARPVVKEDFPRIWELFYTRFLALDKSEDEAKKEFIGIIERQSILALGIERFEEGKGELVAVGVSALVNRRFANALVTNDSMADVQRFIFKYREEWLATETEIEFHNSSPSSKGNILLLLYYNINTPPYCSDEEFQELRQLFHDKWFELCGGFRIAEVIGELWREEWFDYLTGPPKLGGLGLNVVNSYDRFKKRFKTVMARRGLEKAPCILSIKDWRDTKDPLLRKLLTYRSPIFGLTRAQKEAMCSQFGLLPKIKVDEKTVNSIRQRIYQRLSREEFADTWLGMELGKLEADAGKKVLVDNYFRDHLQELRPYPSFRLQSEGKALKKPTD